MQISKVDTAVVFIDPQNEVLSDRGLALGAVGEASIIFRRGITSAQPGSIDRLVLAVYDIDAARGELLSHGVAVSEVFHDAILLCAHPKSDFELFEPAAHHRVMHSQMIWRVQALPPLRGACPELGRTVKSFQLFNRRRSVQTVQPVEGFQPFKSDSEQFYVYPKLDLRFSGASLKKIFCRPAAAAG